ncbi:beta-hexosaminidase [Salinisphaera orenii MK-B5]|uniref:Beta-hexosaminidase n=1 Tax=Salinisphaera orenii MK-B5 TaxID=856730 RepID=A0A423PXS2_9GAMM|nr:beta-N-acetylhexosaminidase [Salinisphaera orenii]ROO30388.1 beta-hexosaminidase [Salinisphaera orenii MK-B5]
MSSAPARPGPLVVDVAGTELSAADVELLAHPAVGAAILFTRNYADPAQLAALTAAMRAARPNLLITADQEGGRVQRFRDGFTRVPPMRALGRLAVTDRDAARRAAGELAWLMAAELAAVGVDVPFAPVLDLDHGASTVIGDRAFAADAATVAALADAFAGGLVEAGSAATAKHFPGHGFVAADSHAELPVDRREARDVRADMAPYAGLIESGLASVMMAHVRYPALDAEPASLSHYWIDTVLRGELGFSGCVFCDDLSMGGAAVVGDHRERARRAQAAGCDFLPVCNDRAAVDGLLEAVALDGPGVARRERLIADCGRETPAPDLKALRADPRWRRAHAELERLRDDEYTRA